jgi:hypothetical protein
MGEAGGNKVDVCADGLFVCLDHADMAAAIPLSGMSRSRIGSRLDVSLEVRAAEAK